MKYLLQTFQNTWRIQRQYNISLTTSEGKPADPKVTHVTLFRVSYVHYFLLVMSQLCHSYVTVMPHYSVYSYASGSPEYQSIPDWFTARQVINNPTRQ